MISTKTGLLVAYWQCICAEAICRCWQ